MNRLMQFLAVLLTPSYDQLINRANHELHMFHLGKYRNFDGAMVHKRRANELFARARQMKEGS